MEAIGIMIAIILAVFIILRLCGVKVKLFGDGPKPAPERAKRLVPEELEDLVDGITSSAKTLRTNARTGRELRSDDVNNMTHVRYGKKL